MARNDWGLGLGESVSNYGKSIGNINLGLGYGNTKKKRKTLTSSQRIYIWERPNQYGRTCNICHNRIQKLSDLELDHTRARSKGGTKLALAHKECNRLKSSGGLTKIQKTLGIYRSKKRKTKPKKRKSKKQNTMFGFPIDTRPPKFKSPF